MVYSNNNNTDQVPNNRVAGSVCRKSLMNVAVNDLFARIMPLRIFFFLFDKLFTNYYHQRRRWFKLNMMCVGKQCKYENILLFSVK